MPSLSGVLTLVNDEPILRLVIGLGTKAVETSEAIVLIASVKLVCFSLAHKLGFVVTPLITPQDTPFFISSMQAVSKKSLMMSDTRYQLPDTRKE